ncbi:glycoside hydrolase family 3 N-terminal domain-containing protein [Streptomyces sp. MB09-02B]|uniref:glycoside hydrolase family 3 N-terminal domain-containing protein n=1 Tax=Streptomyces sp. MB09-02B TaxID=3028667 RepID=UPI0029A81453|nr:glycoside hydrolase family 3 N-terminal domain-containing protein [Streptomyces sp. MB09-02B]MDX3638157.1 glycoside hydrolase family 3 N-terminal domain-containing protein [Streptomyces sp. MB09-02B]
MSSNDHRDVRLPAGERATLLLRELTVEEKCHQLVSVMPWTLVRADGSDSDEAEHWLRNPPGHVAQLITDDPAKLAQLVGSMQRQAVERTRLGIPILFHQEALSGFLAGGHMSFPTGTGLAAAWSPDLVQEMTELIRRQMIRTGMRHALSPVMDVALDPRWGRVHETYGEDPYLAAALAVAFTRGLQGDDLSQGVLATGKHFLGYALPVGGVNTSAYEGGARQTRDLFAYPFEAAIQLAGLRSVMNSYGDVDGIPVGASREVLTDLLRGVLGFDGFVSSDYMTLDQLVERQRVADTPAEAACLAIAAGLDVEMPKPYGYGQVLAEEVGRGNADLADVDTSVWRVLRAKFELGLFENPYPAERIDVAAVAAEGTELSRELARRSVVLAKNDGILPLAGGVKVAVVGPHADAAKLQFATYTYAAWREATDAVLSGELGNMLGSDDVTDPWYKALVTPTDPEQLVHDRFGARSIAEEMSDFAGQVRTEQGSTLTRSLGDDSVARAVEIAQDADVVVLALGGASLWFTGERTEGEASDTADISLPAAQTRLAEAIAATGKPLVVVLVQGRAYALPEVIRDAPAIVMASYGGPFGPKAIAEVLFGATNPSGKLPYSIPRHSGQVPVYHHQKAGSGYRNPLPPSVDRHYLDLEATPLYPFAHGLSYTDFALGDLSHDAQADTDGTVRITATVTNTGPVTGATVVQLYVRVNSKGGVTRPAQQLAGFHRIEVEPGASHRVTFSVAASQLGHTNAVRAFAVEPARVDFFLGFDSDDRRLAGSFDLVGEERELVSAQRAFLSETVTERA